jgi:hypothetical protein
MVSEEPRGVVVVFDDHVPKEDKRPGESDALGRLPFIPYFLVGFPSALHHGAFQ